MLNILIISLVWPEPRASAAGSHMMDLIKALKPISGELTFACTSSPSDHSEDLKSLDIKTLRITVNDPGFDVFIRDLNPDVVVFDRFTAEEQFGWRVREQCPEALRVVNTEDLHGMRKSRELAVRDGRDSGSEIIVMNDVLKREIASLYRSDLNLIISGTEIDLLLNRFRFDPSQLHYFPLLSEVCDRGHRKSLPGYEDRSGFMTVGNFKHPPNQDAVKLLKNDIWPRIRNELPDAIIRIYGAYMNESWRALHDESEGFLMMGHINEVSHAMRSSRLLLAPLRFGAGLKGKIMDAMYNGLPYVTSPIGIEGFETPGFAKIITTDKAEQFAQLAIGIYQDKNQWLTLQADGFNLINKHFERTVHIESLRDAIERSHKDLDKIRKINFLGDVFWHQSLMSSKYMSRWIELKNDMRLARSEHGTNGSNDHVASDNT